jgi:hypothetical protein
MRAVPVAAAVGAILFALASPTIAQQGTSELGGRITDTQGAVLPGVTVTVINEDTGLVREMITGASGNYFMPQMLPGRYRVTAKLDGFKALDRRGIVLAVGQTTTLDLTLDVGDLAETVTVTGASPIVDLSTAEIGGHISSEELQELPAANRNYMSFIGNVPGTVFVPSGEFRTTAFRPTGNRRPPTPSSSTAPTTPTSSAGPTSAVKRASPTSRFRKCRSSPINSTRSTAAPRAR